MDPPAPTNPPGVCDSGPGGPWGLAEVTRKFLDLASDLHEMSRGLSGLAFSKVRTHSQDTGLQLRGAT